MKFSLPRAHCCPPKDLAGAENLALGGWMAVTEIRLPVVPGEPAPDFTLPAASHEGTAVIGRLSGEYFGLLAMMRGLYVLFADATSPNSAPRGRNCDRSASRCWPSSLCTPERVRLYYRYRPVGVPLAADPELVTHRAYGVPQPGPTPDISQAVVSRHLELARELQIPATDLAGIKTALCRRDGFQPIEAEQHRAAATGRTAMAPNSPASFSLIGRGSFAG